MSTKNNNFYQQSTAWAKYRFMGSIACTAMSIITTIYQPQYNHSYFIGLKVVHQCTVFSRTYFMLSAKNAQIHDFMLQY